MKPGDAERALLSPTAGFDKGASVAMPLFKGMRIVESPHLPKDTIYFIGADMVVVAKGVEIPPPSLWTRINRWLFAHWR